MLVNAVPMKTQLRGLIAFQHHPQLLALHAAGLDLAQGPNTHHIVGHVQVNVFVQPHLKRVGGLVGIATVRDQAAFHPLTKAGVARTYVPGLAGFAHQVPQLGALRAVHQVDLKATLLGPARARQHHRDAADRRFLEPEVLEVSHPVAKQGGDHLHRLGALHGQGRHIGLADLDPQPALGRNGARPEPDVGVGDGQPELVVVELQQNRVVDQHALVVAQRHVLALSHLAFGQIARAQNLRQTGGVRPLQLHLAFNRHVPLRNALYQTPVLRLRMAKAGGHQHVVVGGKRSYPLGQGGLVERGRP